MEIGPSTRIVSSVNPCGRIDAIGAGAKIDPVEIQLQDLILGVAGLQPQGEHHLLHLAADGALMGQEQVLGELLGQGRAALDHSAAHKIGDHGPQQIYEIYAEMTSEPTVLDGDDRVRQIFGKLIDMKRFSAGLAAIGDQPPLGGNDLDVRRTGRNLTVIALGQLGGKIGERSRNDDRAPDAGNHSPIERAAKSG